MIISTPAKVNLFLKVAGKRPDGFHAIETLFIPLREYSDELELEFSADGKQEIRVSCSHPAVPENEGNLCWKAAKLTLEALGIKDSVSIQIRKRIPVAGGMGGGSSDAAAVINAIQKKYGILSDKGASIALECGSDVPFFLNPVPAVGFGRGEVLTPVEGLFLPEIRIIPMNFPISAKWAYQHIAPETKEDDRTLDEMISALRKADFSRVTGLLRNDLAPAAFRKFPLLEAVKLDFEKKNPGWKVQLSGSGATLFAVNEFPVPRES